ncbi:hypothetical protein R1flu_000205 [Riccia fluitans]|uniref:Uncharacterized protein n=1 Tax=Riccia fluitans TaxID=41844 RepID=A0ABD1Y085_9MARC
MLTTPMAKHGSTLLIFGFLVLASIALHEEGTIGSSGTHLAFNGRYGRRRVLWQGETYSVPYSERLICNRTCGNVSVPYPFGFSRDCALNPFFVLKCTHDLGAGLEAEGSGPWPVLTFGRGNYTLHYSNHNQTEYAVNGFQVQSIDPGSLIINATTIKAMGCNNEHGNASISLDPESPFVISSLNQFFVLGCRSYGAFETDKDDSECGPISCSNQHVNEFCGPYDCCVQPIPASSTIRLNGGGIEFAGMMRCGFCSILYPSTFRQDDTHEFGSGNYGLRIDWYIPPPLTLNSKSKKFNCSVAQAVEGTSECSPNAECKESMSGYFCNCSRAGYEGDGYKKGTGCNDINECNRGNTCSAVAKCENTDGSYTCVCPEGRRGDGVNRTLDPSGSDCIWIDKCKEPPSPESACSKDAICRFYENTGEFTCSCQGDTVGNGHGENGCKSKPNVAAIIGGSTWGVVFLITNGLLIWFLYRRRRRAYELAVFSCKELIDELGKHEGARFCKVFTLSELEEATNNFADGQKLGAGGFGTVFVGTLKDNTKVAIKKSEHRVGEMRNDARQFVNEIIILSQVNHRNLVSLLGCCLETEVPILVYEFVPNGDLQEQIFASSRNNFGSKVSKHPPLNWNQRFKIAVETAEALNYLHWGTTPPIYHQDVKCANILIDDDYNVKVADFGLSKLVFADVTDAATRLLGGTPGYLDPDFFDRGELTEKSDVFSFGMVLLVMLTAQKPVDLTRLPQDQNLAIRCSRLMSEGLLLENLDSELGLSSEDPDTLQGVYAVAKVALKCVKRYTDERPSMKEVLAELQSVERTATLKTNTSFKTRKSSEYQSQKKWSSLSSLSQSISFQSHRFSPVTSEQPGSSYIEMGSQEREVGAR